MNESQQGSSPWLTAVLAHIRDGVMGVDTAGRVVWMNPAAERMTGKKLHHVKGHGVDAVFESARPPVSDTLVAVRGDAGVQGPYPLSLGDHALQVACTIAPIPESREGGGAVIVLSEQVSGPAPDAAPRPPSRSTPPERVLRVLVMDDDEVVRTLTVQKLIRLGYESEGAANGEEAISKFKAAMDAGAAFDVVVLDLFIRGGMGGKDTVAKLHAIDPDVRAVLTSGHAVDPVLTNFWEYGFSGVVRKPFVIKELDVVIREAIEEV